MAFSQIICFLNENFKPLILITASCFTIYFAYQKFSNKVTANSTVTSAVFSGKYISNVVLTNKKDKVVSIWSVNAIFDKDNYLELDKYNPPIILKPYETISLSFPKYSSLSINGDKYLPDFISGKTELYIDNGNKMIRCDQQFKSNNLDAFTRIYKNITKFNGHVFDDSVCYFITYYYKDKSHTAFVSKSGFISNEWGFSPNSFGNVAITHQLIEWFLKHYDFDKIFSNYVVFKVNYPNYQEVLSKRV